VRDGDRYVIIASRGGAPTNPSWYYNILASPLVTVEAGNETFQARATVAQEPERTRLYNQMVEMMPAFDAYRHKTTRQIPVIVLTPVKGAHSLSFKGGRPEASGDIQTQKRSR
jgi:deazaflavin-dependent oxidoreductase (nitroreductase family)